MDDKKPYLVVLLIQVIHTGLYVISKAALDEGLSTYVFIFYRQAAATLLLAPIAIIVERKSAPHLSLMILFKMFVLSLLGITCTFNLYNTGLRYTSATVASAVTNSVPVITFFLALLLRMETVYLKKVSGIAKIIGVALCFSGIMITAFYLGPHLNPLNHHQFDHKAISQSHSFTNSKTAWIRGTFLMITANTTWSLWLVLQVMLLKEYSSKLLFTAFQCLFSTIQSFFVALAFEREITRWYLSLNMGLLAIAYCGFVVTSLTLYLQTWCIERKGPVFSAMFTPLSLVFTMLCSSMFLGESVHLGSVLGGILMVGGLYCVLWGKGKEKAMCEPTIEEGKECSEEKEIASPCHPL